MFTGFPLEENPIVFRVAQFSYEKAPLSPSWFRFLRFDNGKPNPVAVILLTEIINRYQPIIGDTGWRKRFQGDVLPVDYDDLEAKWAFTARQFKDAAAFLRKKGLIEGVITKEVNVNGHRRFKAYIVPKLDLIEAITKKEEPEALPCPVRIVKDAQTCLRKQEIFLPFSEARSAGSEARSAVSGKEYIYNNIIKNINNSAHAHACEATAAAVGKEESLCENNPSPLPTPCSQRVEDLIGWTKQIASCSPSPKEVKVLEELVKEYSFELLTACYENESARSWVYVEFKIAAFEKAWKVWQKAGSEAWAEAEKVCLETGENWPLLLREQAEWVQLVLEYDDLLMDDAGRQSYVGWLKAINPKVTLTSIRQNRDRYLALRELATVKDKFKGLWERMMALKIEEKVACELLLLDAENCEKLVRYVENTPGITRPAGFVVRGVRENYEVGDVKPKGSHLTVGRNHQTPAQPKDDQAKYEKLILELLKTFESIDPAACRRFDEFMKTSTRPYIEEAVFYFNTMEKNYELMLPITRM